MKIDSKMYIEKQKKQNSEYNIREEESWKTDTTQPQASPVIQL